MRPRARALFLASILLGACQAATSPSPALLSQRSPLLAQAKDLGRAAPGARKTLSVYLRLADAAGAERYAQAVSDPASPSWHRYLTPEAFWRRFGASDGDVALVRRHLEQAGLAVGERVGQRLPVDGDAAAVERAFGVELHRYDLGEGEFLAADREPTLPEAVAARILHVGGLGGTPHGWRPRVAPPYDAAPLAASYDFAALRDAGVVGRGVTVAVYELSGYYRGDVAHFAELNGIPLDGTVGDGPQIKDVSVDGASTHCDTGDSSCDSNGAIEVELDMEVILEMAPGARQLVYVGPNSDTGSGPLDVFNQINVDGLASVVSVSWGLCEPQTGASALAAQHQVLVQSGAQGISIFAAAGDSGAFDCSGQLSVDSPASDPFVTGVGGTALATTASGGYSVESAWSGGGGGLSTTYALPAYQAGVKLAENPSGMRQVPDVSADASPSTGYKILYSRCGAEPCAGASWLGIGGTSAAAPLWAAAWAVVDQALKSPQYSLEALYWLAGNPQPEPPLHDVTSGSNGAWTAGPGYDLATGLGTPRVANLAQDLAQAGASGLAASPAALSFGEVSAGAPSTRTVTVVNGGASPVTLTGFTLSGSGAALFSVQGTTGALAPGASTTVTVTFTPAGAGAAFATLRVATAETYGVRWVDVPVDAEAATSSLTASPAAVAFAPLRLNAVGTQAVTLTNGGSAAVTVTGVDVTPAGDFSLVGPALPATLPAGGTLDLTASFVPSSRGAQAVSALVHASDGDVALGLSGSATGAGLVASATQLDFAPIFANDTGTKTVRVINDGDADLHLALSAPAPFSASADRATVPQGGNALVTVTWSPTQAGTDTGTLALTSQDGDAAPVNVALSGQAAAVDLATDTRSVDFGGRLIGEQTPEIAITITNDAALTVVIEPRLEGPAAADYTVVQPAYAAVLPGKSVQVKLVFQATHKGRRDASLAIRLAGTKVDVLSIPLTGKGLEAAKGCLGCGGPVAPAALLFLPLFAFRRRRRAAA